MSTYYNGGKMTPHDKVATWILYAVVVLSLCFMGCNTANIQRVADYIAEEDLFVETDPTPEPPAEEPEEEPEPVNKGGHGLYKPESSLWLLGKGTRAGQVKTAGEYTPEGRVVKWFKLGTRQGPRADGNQRFTEHKEMYHPPHLTLGGLKFRDAKATKSGNTFKCVLKDGRVFTKVIINRNVRQE